MEAYKLCDTTIRPILARSIFSFRETEIPIFNQTNPLSEWSAAVKRHCPGLFGPTMVRQRVRIRFSKLGKLKFIGHNDLLRTFEALFRRARLPLAMSGGFHPKIRMSFPCALALGYESRDEVLEIEMNESADLVNPDVLLADLNNRSVSGLSFLSARNLDEREKKAQLASSVFEMIVPENKRHNTARQIDSFFAETSVIVEKSNGKPVDVRSAVADLNFSEKTGCLTVELLTQRGPEAGVRELLHVLELNEELFKTIFPKRIQCRLLSENTSGEWIGG
jgi:radical SAM-linked protein